MSQPLQLRPGHLLICVYEDGTRYECPLSEWREANAEDQECTAAIARMSAGDIVTFGGGAQPLCRAWIEASQ